ncbi:MAG: MFS transporter [Pararhizobium sp.]
MPLKPLAGRYTPTLFTALGSLVPYILVASAAALYRTEVAKDISASEQALAVIEGISTAGYAFGALLAGDLINRIAQRHLFLACQALFIGGWLVVAAGGTPTTYGIGRSFAGFATGMLLVTALPPVVRRFPAGRLPLTAAFINIGLFGAVAAGPVLGGLVAGWHAWRLLYAGFAVLGLLIVVIAWFALPHEEPSNPDLPVDAPALILGFAGTFLPFFASGELRAHGFGDLVVAIPLVVGLACFVALLLVEYHKRQALAPVEKMWTTLPVIGTLVAMIAGGAFVTLVLLAVQDLIEVKHVAALPAGLAFWPQIAGVAVAALLLGLLFASRFLPILVLAGMVLLIVGGLMLTGFTGDHADARFLAAVGLLGFGAGATVSPGLFLAGMSLPSKILGRIFALIELVRSVADFIMAPVMSKIARASPGAKETTAIGFEQAVDITLIIIVAGLVVCLVLYVLGGVGLPKPDLKAWVEKDGTAIRSPQLVRLARKGGPSHHCE